MKFIEVFLKILDMVTSVFMVMCSFMFAFIGLAALVCLFVEGDFMNAIGAVVGFILAWICWNIK